MSHATTPLVDWSRIDTVLLDMDGTLLDLNFDNHFWQVHLPQRYAAARGLPEGRARGTDGALPRPRRHAGLVLGGFLGDGTGTGHHALKEEVAHLIDIHPHVTDLPRCGARQRAGASCWRPMPTTRA
jgi:hypothetical protein